MRFLGTTCSIVALSVCAVAQQAASASLTNLPTAPTPEAQSQNGYGTSPTTPPSPAAQSAAGNPTTLSIQDAQALALKNNPQISVARLSALASQQVTREVRSSLWPTANVDLTGVDANPGSRITAGALNNPTVYQRAAAG